MTSTTSSLSVSQLKSITSEFLTALINKPRDFDRAASHMTQDMTMQHDDWPAIQGIENYMSFFKNFVNTRVPEIHMEVKTMVAEVLEDGKGGEVWAYSRITGLENGESRDSVDMIKFDTEGKIYWIQDVQRAITQEGMKDGEHAAETV